MTSDQTRDQISAAATELLRQHQRAESGRRLDSSLAPVDLDNAYAIQDALLGLYESRGESIAGWKLALTSRVMQELVGIDEPCPGAIFTSRVHESAVSLAAAQFVHLGVESEIAVRVGRDFDDPATTYDRGLVGEHVDACMAAIELVDDRAWHYPDIQASDLIADNSFNFGCVIGAPIRDWRALDLSAVAGQMTINGEVVGEGRGADALGHPFESVAWLANHLLRRGRCLRAGDIVLTGSIVATRWLNAGDRMTTTVEGLGEVSLEIS
ncbi:MAG: fumarylacetoacetate hydrolase family protein [Pseudomonadota bacterium]